MVEANKAPFYIVEEFISPLACETIIDMLDFTIPDTDRQGDVVSSVRRNDQSQGMIYERLLLLFPELQAYFRFIYRGTQPVDFEWCPQGSPGVTVHSENSNFARGKWVRTQARDFTGVLFMNDYQEKIPFEHDYEVYGGKLEFPQHQFGFNPQRGTLIVFPSAPHFINLTTPIYAGDLYQARFHIAAQSPYIYQPRNFPGNYTTWFKE